MTDQHTALTERIEHWLKSGDLNRLWPECHPRDLCLAQKAIVAISRQALCSSGARSKLEAEGPARARAFGIAAFASGMGPLLGWWVEKEQLSTDPRIGTLLRAHLVQGRRRTGILRQELRDLLVELNHTGVEAIVLKGLHTGALYFPDPGSRPAADIDLLVHPSRRAAAAQVLKRLGFSETRRTRFASRSEWVRDGSPQEVVSLEIDSAENPWHVDLHTALERWYFRGLRVSLGDQAFAHLTPLVFDGVPACGLGQPYLTAFLALHTSYELVRTRLIRLVELVWVIRKDLDSGTLQWDALVSLLEKQRLGRFVHPAFALVERFCPGTVPAEILDYTGREVTPRLARVIAAVEREHFGFLHRRSLDDKLMWARGARELLFNLSEWIWSSDEAEPLDLPRLYWKRIAMLLRGTATIKATG